MSARNLQIFNILGLVLVLVINALANALPINGYNTGELSDLYPNLFVPAGFTFAIWGVIYLLLSAFVFYQARPLWNSTAQAPEVGLIGYWFFLSCLANASWILAWHYRQVFLSLLIMLFLLTSLIMIYRRLQIGLMAPTPARKWLVHLPFSVYLGWITVATIANTTALLVNWGMAGFLLGESVWTGVMLLIATSFGLFFLLKRKDVPYALVLIWAFYGIMAIHSNKIILFTASGGIAILTLGVLFRLRTWWKH